MSRRATLVLCCAALGAGIGIGSAVDSWSLTTPVRADALGRADLERLSRELQDGHSALVESSRVLAKIATVMNPSVVHIQSRRSVYRRGTVEETGSGVIVNPPEVSGDYIVTNRHVVRNAPLEAITVRLSDGRELHPQRRWTDEASDVAVMQVEADDLQPARWGDSDDVKIGNMVLAMGSPFGLSQSVTYGIVSAKGRRSLKLGRNSEVLNQDFLQTDAAINPGNSGGPLIDLRGRVIGINTAIASNSGGNEGIGFAIPSNLARRVVTQLLKHGEVRRAYIGVKLDPDFDSERAEDLGLDRPQGAHVVHVFSGSPAAEAGVQVDDVILKFNGTAVQDENHLINLVSLAPIAERVSMTVWRDGRQRKLSVTLRDRSELDQRSEVPRRPGMGVPVEPMGLTLHPMRSDFAGQLGFRGGENGLLVLKVDAGSPLDGRIRLYDLIEAVARTPVRTVADVERVLARNEPDDAVLLKVRRIVNGRPESRVVVWQR